MTALQGKSIVITGAGRGIGAALARYAAKLGANVIVNDLEAALAEAVVNDITADGGSASSAACDISRWENAERLIATCVERHGAIDGLVNNAGVLRREVLEESEEATWRRITDVNIHGTAFCLVHAVRMMKRQRRGSIVNATSGAHQGMTHLAAYGASKGAVASLTYCAAMELEGTGVRVNAISPQGATRMMQAGIEFERKLGANVADLTGPDPAQNAPAICYLLSDESRHLNGQIVRIAGGQLSIVSHPIALEPSVREERWSFESVKQAFDGTLTDLAQPLGVVRGRISISR